MKRLNIYDPFQIWKKYFFALGCEITYTYFYFNKAYFLLDSVTSYKNAKFISFT